MYMLLPFLQTSGTGIVSFLMSLGLNPVALTVIIWLIIAVFVFVIASIDTSLGSREFFRFLGFLFVLFVAVPVIVVSLLLWLFNRFEFPLLISPELWLLAGSLSLLGIIWLIRVINADRSQRLEPRSPYVKKTRFRFTFSGSFAVAAQIIGLVASILGIITFIVEYVLP